MSLCQYKIYNIGNLFDISMNSFILLQLTQTNNCIIGFCESLNAPITHNTFSIFHQKFRTSLKSNFKYSRSLSY